MVNALSTTEVVANAKTLEISPLIMKIQSSKSRIDAWNSNESRRMRNSHLEKPAPKGEEERLGEEIFAAEAEVSNTCDKAFSSMAKDGDKVDLKKLKSNLLNSKAKKDSAKTVNLAKAIRFAEENAGGRRSWANVDEILKAYPDAIQDDGLRNQLLNAIGGDIINQGPSALGKDELNVLDTFIKNKDFLGDIERKQVEGWVNFNEGRKMFPFMQVAEKSSFSLSQIIGENITPNQVETALMGLNPPLVNRDNIGQIVARLSRIDGLTSDQQIELKMKALGYAEALRISRPTDSSSTEYRNMSMGVARTLTELAGQDTNVYDLRNGSDQFAIEFKRIMDTLHFSEANSHFQSHDLEVHNNKRKVELQKKVEQSVVDQEAIAAARKDIEDAGKP